ncbi:MAG TPA: ferredoxin [Bacteroidota bacterium]
MINQAVLDIIAKDYLYAVAGECNGCQLCEFLAVNNFERMRGGRGFTVTHQPVTWEEKEQCQEAMDRCPVHGITRTERAVPQCES